MDIPFGSELPKASYSLHIDRMWISVFVAMVL